MEMGSRTGRYRSGGASGLSTPAILLSAAFFPCLEVSGGRNAHIHVRGGRGRGSASLTVYATHAVVMPMHLPPCMQPCECTRSAVGSVRH